MAAAALRVLDDRELANSLRSAGIKAAGRYTWTAARPLLYAVYAKASTAATGRPTKGAHRVPARGVR
jgi:hypothetical protein